MSTGVLYDIHGNLPALDAVLADARAAGAKRFVLGGDFALFGAQPSEVLERLRALREPAAWVRGNVDRWTAYPDQAADDELLVRAVADCRRALGPETAAWLGALPPDQVQDGIRFSHASPRSDMESFLPEAADGELELLAGCSEPLQVFGHTHLQFSRRLGDTAVKLLNPGSVGLPLDGDRRAAYALIDGAPPRVELRRVDYDTGAAIGALQARFGEVPWAVRSGRRLRTGQP